MTDCLQVSHVESLAVQFTFAVIWCYHSCKLNTGTYGEKEREKEGGGGGGLAESTKRKRKKLTEKKILAGLKCNETPAISIVFQVSRLFYFQKI